MDASTQASGAGNLISIDEIVDIKSRRPVATTRNLGWSGVTIDLYGPQSKFSRSYPALDHHVIGYCPSGKRRLIQRRGGMVHESWIGQGTCFLMPAGHDSGWEGDAAASARLRVPASLVASAGEQLGQRSVSRIEIRNVFEARDPVIERIALIFLAELEREHHPAQALLADQLSCALAAHLLRSYNLFDPVEPPKPSSLGRLELAKLTDFIEHHLDRSIGLEELAKLVNVGRFHFTRLFKRSTGMTTSRFVEQCRIHRAKSLIAETDIPLAEVALRTGFSDQSHFTRRFHRQVGCTPAAYARDHGRRRSKLHQTAGAGGKTGRRGQDL